MLTMNPGNGENLTPSDVHKRALMISELYTYYDARFRSDCCPNAATAKQREEGLKKRTEFETRYDKIVKAKMAELQAIYREETGKEPP